MEIMHTPKRNLRGTVAQIPVEIVHEILLRLPAVSLLRFRAVSRYWRNKIDDKSFIDSHRIRSQLSSTTLLIRHASSTRLYSISVDSLIKSAHRDQENLEATSFQPFSGHGLSRIPDFPVSSCNGLILLSGNSKQNWVILNPITRKFHKLPLLRGFYGYPSAGIGYDSSSDDYKVVNLAANFPCSVYSMKTDSWRKIAGGNPVNIRSTRSCRQDGVSINGFLHWKRSKIYHSLIRFNLATELYDELPLPEIDCKPNHWDFGLMDGCLVVSLYYNASKCSEGWVMKEGRWVKFFSIENSIGFMKPIAYLKEKGLVLLTRYHKVLYLFDIEKNSLRIVHILGLPDHITSMMCFSGSLVRLDTKKPRVYVGEANARVKLSVMTTGDVRFI